MCRPSVTVKASYHCSSVVFLLKALEVVTPAGASSCI
jgi:hypothetical protein